MKASIRKKAILLIIASFITLIFLAPNLWMLFGSFKSQNAMFALPPVWIPDFSYIKNFTIMLSESYKYLINSIIVTVCSTIVSLIFSGSGKGGKGKTGFFFFKRPYSRSI